MRKEHRLNVLETGVLGRYLGLTGTNVLDTGVLGRFLCLTGSNMLETGEVLVSKRE